MRGTRCSSGTAAASTANRLAYGSSKRGAPSAYRISKKKDASGSPVRSDSTSSFRPKRRIVTWNGSGVPSERRAIASPSRMASWRGSRRTASTTSGTACDVVQLTGEHPHPVACLVDLDARAVELVLERGPPLPLALPQARQRVPYIIRRLREHWLERPEQLHLKPREAAGPCREGGVRHTTQVGGEHRRPADGLGVEACRARDRLGHEPRERPLPQ